MSKIYIKPVAAFILGMLAFGLAYIILNAFFLVERPDQGGIHEDWGQICLWQADDGIQLSITPKGCYSSSCTRVVQQTETAVVDLQGREIHLEARFVLGETSRFPLPCTKDCSGGGSALFTFDNLLPNDYTIWFKDQRVGEVMVFSGRPTPRQCFENPDERDILGELTIISTAWNPG